MTLSLFFRFKTCALLLLNQITNLFIFSRKTRLHAVLAHVRLPLVSPYFLHDWVEKNPFVSGSPDSLHIVEEAKLFHLLPDRRPDFEHSARFTPR